MGQDNTWGVKNTTNDLWMTSYNADPELCGWGNEGDAINTMSQAFAEQEASDLNSHYTVDYFIGGHPRPH